VTAELVAALRAVYGDCPWIDADRIGADLLS